MVLAATAYERNANGRVDNHSIIYFIKQTPFYSQL